jgi:hypothetical protein
MVVMTCHTDVAISELKIIYLIGHVGESLLDMWHIFVKWCGATWPTSGMPHGTLGLVC